MSAYVVAKETLDRILSRVSQSEVDRFASEFGIEATHTALGRLMHDLNCFSIGERYGRKAEKEDRYKEDYEFYRMPTVTEIQAYKSLRCFLYQSCEGKAESEPLYMKLESLGADWAASIVSNLPEYDNATWG